MGAIFIFIFVKIFYGAVLAKAVIVIDMLNDFVYGPLKFENVLKIIPNIKILVEAARKCGVPVIY
ncbi:MAG: isochorismatase family protein, partial [Candidatus Methanomethylicia archaeon]